MLKFLRVHNHCTINSIYNTVSRCILYINYIWTPGIIRYYVYYITLLCNLCINKQNLWYFETLYHSYSHLYVVSFSFTGGWTTSALTGIIVSSTLIVFLLLFSLVVTLLNFQIYKRNKRRAARSGMLEHPSKAAVDDPTFGQVDKFS